MDLLKKIQSKKAVVGIVGMGYVGLPLVFAFAHKGFRVLGFDIDKKKIVKLNRGESYIKHIQSKEIAGVVKDKSFEATDNFKRLKEADCILICVPTPLDAHLAPDLTYVENTAKTISEHLRRGQLVVLESTTYPGTTDEVVKPILEKSGLVCGTDFFLAFSPEREDPGNKNFNTVTIPKVVGGHDERSLKLADSLYAHAVAKTVPVNSMRVAEACKILENIYRCVNIALVNELKMLFDKMGIDIWEVIAAASTKPFGFNPFYPGPGLGGHCIPIDPFYLTWKAAEYGFATRFISLAGEINSAMPDYVIHRLMEAFNIRHKTVFGSRILILGLAYKKNVDDMRESPSLRLIEKLMEKGAQVEYNDPHIPVCPKTREYHFELESVALTPKNLASFDAVIVSTDHDAYDYETITKHAHLVIDSRNATKNVKKNRDKIVKA
jgi:UDP-N-acetyl-D-glucosamine dehydrogenase